MAAGDGGRRQHVSVPVVLITAAHSNAGKTTVAVALIEALTARGTRVAYVKRAHHAVDADTAGKDTHRARTAGAVATVLGSTEVAAVFVPQPSRDPGDLAALACATADADVVLVEGGKEYTEHPRIVVVPDGEAFETLPDAVVLAVVGRGVSAPDGVPVIAPDEIGRLADLFVHIK